MSKDIYSVSLLDLLPESLKQDQFVTALAEAVSLEMREISSEARKVLMYLFIDELPEEVIDLLAWQDHVDFYEPDLPLGKKRELVGQAFSTHMSKGTPWAVDQVVSAAFDDSKVEEWFEYDGEPFYFRITTTDRMTDDKKYSDIFRAINAVKNLRSRLESITIRRDNQMGLYAGGVVTNLKIITIKPAT
jgi:phage tail P2-like protein